MVDSPQQRQETYGINTYREGSLHSALKTWYAAPGDRVEVLIDEYIVDIVHNTLLVEIQTGNFSALKYKLNRLLKGHPVRVVHPIAATKWITKLDSEGHLYQRRKSPKKGHWSQVAKELIFIHQLIADPNFSLQILMIEEEEIRRLDGKGSWRRGRWSVIDHKLLSVREQVLFHTLTDYLRFLPNDLPLRFTTKDLAIVLGQSRRIAQMAAYTLHKIGLIQKIGKQERSTVYELADTYK